MVARAGKSGLFGLFSGRDPRNKGTLALARLLSQHDMESMSYDEGIEESRRCDMPRPMALGAMLIPYKVQSKLQGMEFENAMAICTCDLRREGIGVLTTRRFDFERCVIAIPDAEDVWKFFSCTCRHTSRRPGGWWQMGLHVDSLVEPDADQMRVFRARCSELLPDGCETSHESAQTEQTW